MTETGSGGRPRASIDPFELEEEIEDAVTRTEAQGLHGHEALHAVMDELGPSLPAGTEHGVATAVWRRLTDPEADHGTVAAESLTTLFGVPTTFQMLADGSLETGVDPVL